MLRPASGCMAALVVCLFSGCTEKTPSREHIPHLRQRIFVLQEAVKARNPAAIDSLLAPEILAGGQDSDSLLRFVYGPDDDFSFQQFGDCEYIYVSNRARCNCFVMDSSRTRDRPIEFTLVYRHELWLLKRFDAGRRVEVDSI